MGKDRDKNDQIKLGVGEWKPVLSGLVAAAGIVLLVINVGDLEFKSREPGGYVLLTPANAAGNDVEALVGAAGEIAGERNRHAADAATHIQHPTLGLQAAPLFVVPQELFADLGKTSGIGIV